MIAEGLTRRMRPLSSIMQVFKELYKFVDSPGRFLNLYGRVYGPYNLPYKFKNRPGESTNLQGSPHAWFESGRIRLVRPSAVIITHKK